MFYKDILVTENTIENKTFQKISAHHSHKWW